MWATIIHHKIDQQAHFNKNLLEFYFQGFIVPGGKNLAGMLLWQLTFLSFLRLMKYRRMLKKYIYNIASIFPKTSFKLCPIFSSSRFGYSSIYLVIQVLNADVFCVQNLFLGLTRLSQLDPSVVLCFCWCSSLLWSALP